MSEPRRRPLRQRVFFYYALAWLIAVALVATAVLVPWYRQSVALVQAELDAAVDQELVGLAARFGNDGLAGLAAEIDWRSRHRFDPEAVYLLANDTGTRLAGNLPQWPIELTHPREGRFSVRLAGGGSLRGTLLHIGSAGWLLAGRHSPVAAFESRLQQYAFAASAGLLLATALCAWLFGRHLGRRLQRMADEADTIRTGDLGRRLTVSARGDELDGLADRFNDTFADLQRSIDGVRHVSSAIAHDLRRPLIRLRQQLESAARASVGVTAMATPLQEALLAVDEALAVFSALLRLARIESGGLGQMRQPLALDVILSDAAELHRPLFNQQGRELQATLVHAPAIGDRDLLFQLAHNLIENALRHGKGTVALTLQVGETIAFTVSDQGAGVDATEMAHLGERFWRADTARSSEGSGLGLSLCRAIVDAHGGSMRFMRLDPGFCVRVELPAVAATR